MMLQLNPPIPLMTPKGEGLAHFVIDYSIEDHLYWVVFIKDTGECWTLANPEIRACKNISIGRTFDKSNKFIMSKDIYNKLSEAERKGLKNAVEKGFIPNCS